MSRIEIDNPWENPTVHQLTDALHGFVNSTKKVVHFSPSEARRIVALRVHAEHRGKIGTPIERADSNDFNLRDSVNSIDAIDKLPEEEESAHRLHMIGSDNAVSLRPQEVVGIIHVKKLVGRGLYTDDGEPSLQQGGESSK